MLAGHTKDEEKRAAPTSGGNTRGHQGNELLRRAEQAQGAWPTPLTSDANGAREEDGKRGVGLNTRVQTWQTPQARDFKGETLFASGHRHGPGLLDQATALAGLKSSSEPRTLNPLFVEWLMGLPLGWSIAWTGSAASATV